MRKIFAVLIPLLFFCLVGCSPVSSGSGTGGQEAGVNNSESTMPPAVSGEPVERMISNGSNGETTTIVLYFAGHDGNLIPEQREVPKVPGIARKTMEELCRGPESEGLLATLPPGTHLLDINIRDHLCTVDFSPELIENHPGGSSGELITTYSIVNTLTQFPSVEKVVIRIGGREVQTLAGHLDLSVPLERNYDLLKG